MLVAIPDPLHVLLVREYAVGIEKTVLGLPKGGAEPHEDYLQAAQHELCEEVGMRAARLSELGELTLAPGHLCHRYRVVLAEQLSSCQLVGDEPEPLECLRVPLAQIPDLVARGELNEARAAPTGFVCCLVFTSSPPGNGAHGHEQWRSVSGARVAPLSSA
ncbi:NUDIX domain-containing protein [Pseudomonas sp. ZB1P45]|uniref:NUDIX domain-containing protein n=1 Tax=Pseudomonas frigoris TaxID=3398356 RepID=UPI0039EF279F